MALVVPTYIEKCRESKDLLRYPDYSPPPPSAPSPRQFIQSVVGKRMAATWVVGGCRRCKSPWISSTDQRGTESPNLQILFNSNRRRRFYDFPPPLHIHIGELGRTCLLRSIHLSHFHPPVYMQKKGFTAALFDFFAEKNLLLIQIITGGCLPISLYPVKFRISDHEEYENNNVVVTSRHHRWRGISFTRCGWMAEMLKAVNRRFTFE